MSASLFYFTSDFSVYYHIFFTWIAVSTSRQYTHYDVGTLLGLSSSCLLLNASGGKMVIRFINR